MLSRILATVAAEMSPLNEGEPQRTRNDPSSFGWKLTVTAVVPCVDACTFRPVAVSAASEPKVWPEFPGCELSIHVCDNVATAPEASACGTRPAQRLTVA